MGIVKIVSGEPVVKDISSYGDEDLTKDEIVLLQSFPSHGSCDLKHQELGCELAMSRGQTCSIPYGLYDLPELAEVLSLETWNLRLTEDDRVRLAAYLPDMDRGDFCTTMKELFGGDAMFFASPLTTVFHSGFYSPDVSQARELLMTLERRRHYHFLKLYHNGIVRKFAPVDRMLKSSGMSASFGEMGSGGFVNRLQCVGLDNSSLPLIVKDDAAVFSPLKRAKLVERTLTTRCSTSHKETSHTAKLVELNSSESEIIHSSRPNTSIPPKGVGKVRTGCDYHTDVSDRVHHTPGLILFNQLGMPSSSFCMPSHAFSQDAHVFAETSSSHTNKISSGSSALQWKGAPETYTLMAESPLGVQMTLPEGLRAVHPSVMLGGFYHPAANRASEYSGEACYTRELPHMKNLAPDPYTRVSDGHQMSKCTTMHSSKNAESVSQMLNAGSRIYPPCNDFAEQLETVRNHHDHMKLAKSATEV